MNNDEDERVIDADGNIWIKRTAEITVSREVFYLTRDYGNGTHSILSGGEKDIFVQLKCRTTGQNGEVYEYDVDDYNVIVDTDSFENVQEVTFSDGDKGKHFHVMASNALNDSSDENFVCASFKYSVVVPDNNSGIRWSRTYEESLEITDAYAVLELNQPDIYLSPEDRLNVDDFDKFDMTLTIFNTTEDGKSGIKVDKIHYIEVFDNLYFDVDDNAGEITLSEYALDRLKNESCYEETVEICAVYVENESTDEERFYEGYAEVTLIIHNHDRKTLISGRAATCTSSGITDGRKCSICGKEVVKQTTISPKGHSLVHYAATDTTIEYWKCSVCGLYFSNSAGTRQITKAQLDAANTSKTNAKNTAAEEEAGKAAEETITIPKVPSQTKPKKGKGKATIKWKKFKKTKKTKAIWKQINNIEVQYSTDSAFPKNTTTSVIIGKTKTKLVVKGLQKGTYYSRLRYTDGANGYSNWSKIKKVTIK